MSEDGAYATDEELTEKFNEEVKTPQNDTEETAEINTNDPEKQEEDPASHAEEKLGIENDGKLDQEELKSIEKNQTWEMAELP